MLTAPYDTTLLLTLKLKVNAILKHQHSRFVLCCNVLGKRRTTVNILVFGTFVQYLYLYHPFFTWLGTSYICLTNFWHCFSAVYNELNPGLRYQPYLTCYTIIGYYYFLSFESAIFLPEAAPSFHQHRNILVLHTSRLQLQTLSTTSTTDRKMLGTKLMPGSLFLLLWYNCPCAVVSHQFGKPTILVSNSLYVSVMTS